MLVQWNLIVFKSAQCSTVYTCNFKVWTIQKEGLLRGFHILFWNGIFQRNWNSLYMASQSSFTKAMSYNIMNSDSCQSLKPILCIQRFNEINDSPNVVTFIQSLAHCTSYYFQTLIYIIYVMQQLSCCRWVTCKYLLMGCSFVVV